NALHFGRNDERGRFVIGISCARTDGGNEIRWPAHDVAVPFAIAVEERDDGFAARHGAIENHVRIEPNQLPIATAVTVARTGSARLDVAQDGAGVAPNCVLVR